MTALTLNIPDCAASRVAAAVGRLLNGNGWPAAGSTEFAQLTEDVGALVNGTDGDREFFASITLRFVIDSAGAHIKTAQVLRNFGKDAFE